MKTFQYQLLRFLPDRVSGEFLNLGVVVFDPSEKIMALEISEKAGRLSKVFPNIRTKHILKIIAHIDFKLKVISRQLSSEFEFNSYSDLSEITRQVLPKDDSALFFSETKKILDLDIKAVTSYLFSRLISISQDDSDKEFRSDKEVWSKVYKKYFDARDISKYLQPAQIQTKFNNVTFEHSWRNGHLNFFESVNFDLEKSESIRNKVFRWSGQIDELKTSDEKSHLYLLSVLPKDTALENFILEFLTSKASEKVYVELVTPENVKRVTDTLKVEMEEHDLL